MTALAGGFAVEFQNGDGTANIQRYDASGSAIGAPIPVAAQGTLLGLADGGFMISWEGTDSSGSAVKAQIFDSAGHSTGDPFLLNVTSQGGQFLPSLVLLADGSVAAAWQSTTLPDYPFGSYSIGTRILSPAAAPATAHASDDAFLTDEVTTVAGNLLANNGSGADTGSSTVAQVNGSAGNVGHAITLASGASLTVNADGTFTYNPNHAFDSLAQYGTGGSNQEAFDSFTYALVNSNIATVTIDVRGLYSSPHVIEGTPGNDTLTGTPQADIFQPGTGADIMAGGNGDDTYYVDNSGDRANETSATGGNDIVFSSVSFTLGANVERLTLTGAGNITGVGNALDNTLVGNSGNNTLSGAAGADSMTGGLGDDIYWVENAGDTVTERSGQGNDTVQSWIDYTLGANVENLILTSTAVSGTGNGLDNAITGNASSNVLSGGVGNDVLNGAVGADQMTGGVGNDTYVVDQAGDVVNENAGEGSDTVQSTISYTLGANVEVLTLIGTGDINGTGNGLANSLNGNSGANTLDGGAGADLMFGGNGDDTYIVSDLGDRATEVSASGGYDTVLSSISFAIAS
ncbi:MAG: calcium-binding protein, partial [Alphaproteobacteria bacterium]